MLITCYFFALVRKILRFRRGADLEADPFQDPQPAAAFISSES